MDNKLVENLQKSGNNVCIEKDSFLSDQEIDYLLKIIESI